MKKTLALLLASAFAALRRRYDGGQLYTIRN